MPVLSLAQRALARRWAQAPIWLVCLNLRNRFATAGHPLCVPNAAAIAPEIARVLAFARARNWRIVHVVNQPSEAGCPSDLGHASLALRLNGSLPGLEPKIAEPVYHKTGPSLFSAPEFAEYAANEEIFTIVVAGLAPALDWIATALDARDIGWPMRIICDAMGMPALWGRSPADDRATLSALLAPIADLVPLASAIESAVRDD